MGALVARHANSSIPRFLASLNATSFVLPPPRLSCLPGKVGASGEEKRRPSSPRRSCGSCSAGRTSNPRVSQPLPLTKRFMHSLFSDDAAMMMPLRWQRWGGLGLT